MGSDKHQYLKQIRSNTAYPTYRGIIASIAALGYVCAIVVGLLAWIVAGLFGAADGAKAGAIGIGLLGLLLAVLIYAVTRFFREAAVILADLSDSTLEANARTPSHLD